MEGPESVALSPPPSPALALSVPDLPSSTEFRKEKPKAPTRSLSVNNRAENAPKMFPSNVIRTSKYTPLTFLPINLFEQFRRIANFYFLVIICMSIPSELAPYPWYTTAMPLVFILAISGVKDGYEDFLRHREDRIANSRVFQTVTGNGSLQSMKSGDITVGDVIRIEEGQEFPADLILLQTSKHDNTCYVNTANLDGEVTPKLRIGPQLVDQYNAELDLALLNGAMVESGDPCKQLDGFEGTLTLSNGIQRPIGDRQVLLRGAKLRGTTYVYAVVFATGPETKLMLNRNPIRYKFSSFERVLNRCVLASLVIELVLCIVMAALNHFQHVATLSDSDMMFLDVEQNRNAFPGLKLFITSFILYSFLIPVSLFVTIDFVKIGQAMVIEMDNDMSIPASNADRAEGVHRLYSTVKSSNLNDELGQIEYLFSDKTGTLTCNRMELSNVSADGFISHNKRLETVGVPPPPLSGSPSERRRTSVAPRSESGRSAHTLENLIQWAFRVVIQDGSVNARDPVNAERRGSMLSEEAIASVTSASLSKSEKPAQDMLFCMLVCNDVQPEKNGDRVEFVSASPDEIALVGALARNGLRLISAGPSQPWVIRLDNAPDHTFTFERIAHLDFSSDRRRMSVVVYGPDGSAILFTKGASSTIEPFLSDDPVNKATLAETQKHLTQFAKLGSRTLMMASTQLESQQLAEFISAYERATVELQGREKAIERAFAMIEKNLRLLGATSVEDQLQEQVPETIEQLLKAGITIMMLTGDMQETAVTIGRKSRIISKDSKLVVIQAETPKQVEYLLDRYITKADANIDDKAKAGKLAMVLNGNSLEMAIQYYPDKFLLLFSRCETIICNRATPSQKAFVVALVTSRFPGITMAIGDGANDVSMIRKAHVGVGLIGREGRQAAQSADFVLHRFSHLKRLLFVHGRYSYQRSSRVVLFSFFKNFLYPLPLFWYSCYSQFSGQSIYDSLIITNFNMFFSSLPPLIAGVLEKDVVEKALLKHPIAYKKFRESPTFTLSIFLSWMALGTYQSLVIYFIGHAFFYPSEGSLSFKDGIVLDMWTFGTWIGTVAIINVNLSFLVRTTNLTMATIICSAAGIFFYLVFLAGYCAWFPKIAPNMYGMNTYVFATPTAYLYYFVSLTLCLVPIIVSNFLAREYKPTYGTVLREHCTGDNKSAKLGDIGCCLTDHIENVMADDDCIGQSDSSSDGRQQERKLSLQKSGSESHSEGQPPPQLQIKIDVPPNTEPVPVQILS